MEIPSADLNSLRIIFKFSTLQTYRIKLHYTICYMSQARVVLIIINMQRLFLVASLLFLALNDDFFEFKDEMERKVKGIASEMEAIYGRRCENHITSCSIKSYNEC